VHISSQNKNPSSDWTAYSRNACFIGPGGPIADFERRAPSR
jgi:hypothetical protein